MLELYCCAKCEGALLFFAPNLQEEVVRCFGFPAFCFCFLQLPRRRRWSTGGLGALSNPGLPWRSVLCDLQSGGSSPTSPRLCEKFSASRGLVGRSNALQHPSRRAGLGREAAAGQPARLKSKRPSDLLAFGHGLRGDGRDAALCAGLFAAPLDCHIVECDLVNL
jgi:hypothetical protein